MFTNPGTPWLKKTVFCLGSGPSLNLVTVKEWGKIKELQRENLAIVLGVNSSFKKPQEFGFFCDALFFTDESWFENNEKQVRDFKGNKFTVSRRAKNMYPELDRIENSGRFDFSVGSPPMKDGRSSGHRAVSLAIMLGSKKIGLLGYDMRILEINGKLRSHHHDEYHNTENARTYKEEFAVGFRGWREEAEKLNVEIINLTKDSAVEDFKFQELSEFLEKINSSLELVS
jgi:hypothetical protein